MSLKTWRCRHGRITFEMANGRLLVQAGHTLKTVALYEGERLLAMGLGAAPEGSYRNLRNEIARKAASVYAGLPLPPDDYIEIIGPIYPGEAS